MTSWVRGWGLNFASQAHLKVGLLHSISCRAREHIRPRGDLSRDSWSFPLCTRGNSSLQKSACSGGIRSQNPEALSPFCPILSALPGAQGSPQSVRGRPGPAAS